MTEAIGTTVSIVLIAAVALWQDRRARRAEKRVAELAKLDRGAPVERWYRKVQVPNSDPWYYHVKTSRGDLLLTEEQFTVARVRADGLLR